jgi:hypothetical protein
MIAALARVLIMMVVAGYLSVGIILGIRATINPQSGVNPWLLFLAWPAYAVRGV